MKNLCLILLALLSAAALAPGAQSNSESLEEKRVIDEVMARERERVQAMLHQDSGALDQLFAENYMQVTSFGELRNRSHIINGLKAKALKYDAIENSDHRFAIHQGTVVVTGLAKRKGRERGRDLSGEFRFIRTWVKNDRTWQLLAQQSTLLPKGASAR